MKPKIFLPLLILPALLSLLGFGFFADGDNRILYYCLIVIAAVSVFAGLWLGFRRFQANRSCLFGGVAMAGVIFVVNVFVLFMGCGTPRNEGYVQPKEYRPSASSKKEMARVAASIPPRDARLTSGAVDLAPYYNATLDENWWTRIGAQNLSLLSAGLQTLAGIPFDVRGVVRISSEQREDEGRKFPASAKKLRLDRVCHRIHFLHGNGWDVADQTQIATFVIHYSDGGKIQIPIVYGRNVLGSWFLRGQDPLEKKFVASGGIVAWKKATANVESKLVDGRIIRRLFLTTWQNPRPEVKIRSVDFESNRKIFATPFLVALTIDSNE